MACGFAIMEGDTDHTSQSKKNNIDNNNIDNRNIENRQQWALCGGPTISLNRTSWAKPVVVQSPNFPMNYPINLWLVSITNLHQNEQNFPRQICEVLLTNRWFYEEISYIAVNFLLFLARYFSGS